MTNGLDVHDVMVGSRLAGDTGCCVMVCVEKTMVACNIWVASRLAVRFVTCPVAYHTLYSLCRDGFGDVVVSSRQLGCNGSD